MRSTVLSSSGVLIDQHHASARFDGQLRERDRHVRIGEPTRFELRLGLLDTGAFDETLVVGFLPYTVVEGEDLDVAHFVLLEARACWSLLRFCCTNEGDGLREPKHCIRPGGAEDEIAT